MVSGKKKNNFIEDGKINEKIINKIRIIGKNNSITHQTKINL